MCCCICEISMSLTSYDKNVALTQAEPRKKIKVKDDNKINTFTPNQTKYNKKKTQKNNKRCFSLSNQVIHKALHTSNVNIRIIKLYIKSESAHKRDRRNATNEIVFSGVYRVRAFVIVFVSSLLTDVSNRSNFEIWNPVN